MINRGEYSFRQKRRGTGRSAAFDIAKLQAQLERAKAMGIMAELPNNTVYLKDKILEVETEVWFKQFLRTNYTFILSSPEVWNKLIKL